MPEFIVHLHQDVFYDIQVTADDEDQAFEQASKLVTDEHIDRKALCPIELSDATRTPIHEIGTCDDVTCQLGNVKHG